MANLLPQEEAIRLSSSGKLHSVFGKKKRFLTCLKINISCLLLRLPCLATTALTPFSSTSFVPSLTSFSHNEVHQPKCCRSINLPPSKEAKVLFQFEYSIFSHCSSSSKSESCSICNRLCSTALSFFFAVLRRRSSTILRMLGAEGKSSGNGLCIASIAFLTWSPTK